MNRHPVSRIKGKVASHGVLTVPGKLNGQMTLWFLVDTGAAMTTISRPIAAKMGLDITQPNRWLSIVSAHQMEKVPIFHLETLQVGGQVANNIEVAVITLPPSIRVDGLLGVNFYAPFVPPLNLTKPHSFYAPSSLKNMPRIKRIERRFFNSFNSLNLWLKITCPFAIVAP